MTPKHAPRLYLFPLILISLGFIFLFQNFGYLDFGELISRYWPLILILIGLRILWHHRGSPVNEMHIFGIHNKKPATDSILNTENSTDTSPQEKLVENIFGDVRFKFRNELIEKFKASNVFGDFDLDFSQASLLDQSIIQVNGVFGDVNICFPSEINIVLKANYIGGSSHIFDEHQSGLFKNISYTTPTENQKKSTVFVEISIIFGDIWIYNSIKN